MSTWNLSIGLSGVCGVCRFTGQVERLICTENIYRLSGFVWRFLLQSFLGGMLRKLCRIWVNSELKKQTHPYPILVDLNQRAGTHLEATRWTSFGGSFKYNKQKIPLSWGWAIHPQTQVAGINLHVTVLCCAAKITILLYYLYIVIVK